MDIPASIQNITPQCRENRGDGGALEEAMRRIEQAYWNYVGEPDNARITGLSNEGRTGMSNKGSSDSYEAMVYSAYLPNRTVAFIFPESGIPFCSGVFRIEYLRPATEADHAAFPSPNADSEDEICPLCNRVEEFK